MHVMPAADVPQLLRGRMGLIIGPGITKFPTAFSDLAGRLAESGNVASGGTYLDVADRMIDAGAADATVAERIREIVGSQQPSTLISQLCKARWGAVLSASLDMHFEDGFQQASTGHPSRQPVTVLADLRTMPPPRSIAVYKLLGVAARDGFARSQVTYVERRSAWRHAVKGFADAVKGNPVLCLGMDDCVWVMLDLLAEMLGERTALPAHLLFVSTDPLIQNTRVQQLLDRRVKTVAVRGTVGELARATNDAAKGRYGKSLPFPEGSDDSFATLRPYGDIAAIVNEHLAPQLAATERNQLLDLLFSPSVARWDPYAFDLDFRRTAEAHLLDNIRAAAAQPDSTAGVLTGSAATGKTVLLKRAAFELARAGMPVLWLKPWHAPDVGRQLRELIEAAGSVEAWGGKTVVVVMDDPLNFGNLTPRDVASAARATDSRVHLLVGVRLTDWLTIERSELTGSLPLAFEESLPDALDDNEWQRLADYLVALKIVADKAAADTGLAEVAGKQAQDTLSMLYYLLPQTRTVIAESLRDEYFRLGDVSGLKRVIAHLSRGETDLLRRAYECVAVTERYRGFLPMEVLVSDLGIDFGEWIDISKSHSAVWGLLYEEDDPDGSTVWYRTRNEIVTRTIVHTLNGGSLVHTGELRVLESLLRACTGRSSSVYREFCIRVLVPPSKLDHLTYEEALRLYDTALGALQLPDRTLLHHKGRLIKNRGQSALEALQVLNEALKAPDYPYTAGGEADEHIQTTLAATVLDGINQGVIPLDDGKQQVLGHLDKAQSDEFFNPRSVHVHANLISRLIDKASPDQMTDTFALMNRAVGNVEHTLMVLQSRVDTPASTVTDVKMLEDIRDQVLNKAADLDELVRQANEVWEKYANQEGFLIAARKYFSMARTKNKKYERAFEYCQRAIVLAEEAKLSPLPGLLSTSVQIYYHWRVRRQVMSGNTRIDWAFLRDQSARVLASRQYANDNLHRYIYGLALSHLLEWSLASGVFMQIRQANLPTHVLWAARDYFLNETGGIRQVQGVMRQLTGRLYLLVDDLQNDFIASRRGTWPRPGEIAHAAIEFTFGGPTAVDRW